MPYSPSWPWRSWFCITRYTKASQILFAARQDAARYRSRLEAAKRAAREAEERCKQLFRQVNTSMASTGQALNVARDIEAVREQLNELLRFIGYWDEPGRHEPTPEIAEPASLPHAHADHARQLPAGSGYWLSGPTERGTA